MAQLLCMSPGTAGLLSIGSIHFLYYLPARHDYLPVAVDDLKQNGETIYTYPNLGNSPPLYGCEWQWVLLGLNQHNVNVQLTNNETTQTTNWSE